MHLNMWDEIFFTVPNVNGEAIEVGQEMNYFIPL